MLCNVSTQPIVTSLVRCPGLERRCVLRFWVQSHVRQSPPTCKLFLGIGTPPWGEGALFVVNDFSSEILHSNDEEPTT